MSIADDFFDDFNRPDGSAGNGWTISPDSNGGSIAIFNDVLSTSGAGGTVGLYRPIDLSRSVTISADITPTSGFGGLQLRYTTAFLFGGDGTTGSGYGLHVYRGDQNFDNSAVFLVYNGQVIAELLSTFQFGERVHVAVTLETDGTLHGTVSAGQDVFNFSFAAEPHTYSGSNFTICQELPDIRSSFYTDATVDNLLIDIGSDGTETPLLFQQPFAMGDLTLFTDVRDGDDWTVTNDFGESTPSTLPNHRGHKHYHLGEDWVPEKGKALGTDVFAVADGTVVYAQNHPFFGKTVVIAHDVSANGLGVDTVYSLYAHLDSIQVGLGGVERGDMIGEIGKTGAAQGAHLHWEIFSADWAAYLAGPLLGYSEQPNPSQWFDPTDFVSGFLLADSTQPAILTSDHTQLML